MDGHRGEGRRQSEGEGRGQPVAREADPVAVAKAIALRQLTAAPRSRAELAQAMARKGVPDDAAKTVLDRFEEVKLLDDPQYAAMLVRSRQATKGLARRGLAHELRAKGIDDETAREALDQVDPDDELSAARALVARRMPSMARLPADVAQRRLAGMLARKGYAPGMAITVVRQALRERGADVADDSGTDDSGTDDSGTDAEW